jgi:hypothetical protein
MHFRVGARLLRIISEKRQHDLGVGQAGPGGCESGLQADDFLIPGCCCDNLVELPRASQVLSFLEQPIGLRTNHWRGRTSRRSPPCTQHDQGGRAEGRAGELVSREEVRNAVWADGTTVEFDQGLNIASAG